MFSSKKVQMIEEKVETIRFIIGALRKEVEEQNEQMRKNIQNISNCIKELKDHFLAFKESKAAKQIDRECERVKESTFNLNKEIMDFKLLKGRLYEKLVEQISMEIKDKLFKQLDQIKTDIKIYNEVKENIKKLKAELDMLKEEITQFRKIVKEKDFELTGYVNKITQMDQEKLRLMQQVKTLQKLVAAERRKQR
ncbi:hypothetical protein DRJ17_05380 [Candidatus Woesearchaeota archaeon]|nr:MAG: hypothetical protein DRJ17_05380 [Candidatus Woesearchaeota archaeon]